MVSNFMWMASLIVNLGMSRLMCLLNSHFPVRPTLLDDGFRFFQIVGQNDEGLVGFRIYGIGDEDVAGNGFVAFPLGQGFFVHDRASLQRKISDFIKFVLLGTDDNLNLFFDLRPVEDELLHKFLTVTS